MAVEMLAQSANYGSFFSFILFTFSRRFFFTVITAQNTATMLLEGRANKFTVAKKKLYFCNVSGEVLSAWFYWTRLRTLSSVVNMALTH